MNNGHIRASLLSGGQRQNLLIEMLPDVSLYLLDEPFIGLDKGAISMLAENLGSVIAQGQTILMAMPEYE